MTQAGPRNSGESETAAGGRSRKTLLVYLFGALGGLNWGYAQA